MLDKDKITVLFFDTQLTDLNELHEVAEYLKNFSEYKFIFIPKNLDCIQMTKEEVYDKLEDFFK